MTPLPQSLLRFEALLERSIERDLQRGRRSEHRRAALRVATAAACVAAIGFGAVSLLGDDGSVVGRSVVGEASAQQRALAALSPAPGSVVHEVAVTRHVAPDRSESTLRAETWRATEPPYARRSRTTAPGGATVETLTVGSQATQLYDSATDTIYTAPPAGGPSLGTPAPAAPGDPLVEQLRGLLRSADGRAVQRGTEDGRDVVRFTLRDRRPGGSAVDYAYVVDAATYEPLRITVDTPDGARTNTRFERYDTLPAGAEADAQLSLRAQHPAAAIDRTEAGYAAAQARLAG